MFVSVPFLVFGACILLLLGILIGRGFALTKDLKAHEMWLSGYWWGHETARLENMPDNTAVDMPEPRFVGEE